MKKLTTLTILTSICFSINTYASEKNYNLKELLPKASDVFEHAENNKTDLPYIFAFNNHALIIKINQHYNKIITWTEDKSDIWQNPKFTYRFKTGDCEDFTFLKYEHLKKSGVNPKNIRFVAGSFDDGTYHMYLKVFDGEYIYYLDNGTNKTTKPPFEDNKILYEFNEFGYYLK